MPHFEEIFDLPAAMPQPELISLNDGDMVERDLRRYRSGANLRCHRLQFGIPGHCGEHRVDGHTTGNDGSPSEKIAASVAQHRVGYSRFHGCLQGQRRAMEDASVTRRQMADDEYGSQVIICNR
jgi:hypothetical protein